MPRIHVGVRVKPESGEVLSDFTTKSVSNGKGEIAVKVEIGIAGNRTEFTFDNIFSPTCTQADLFNGCAKQIVDEVLDGYNGTIFAYGQTGYHRCFCFGRIYTDIRSA